MRGRSSRTERAVPPSPPPASLTFRLPSTRAPCSSTTIRTRSAQAHLRLMAGPSKLSAHRERYPIQLLLAALVRRVARSLRSPAPQRSGYKQSTPPAPASRRCLDRLAKTTLSGSLQKRGLVHSA